VATRARCQAERMSAPRLSRLSLALVAAILMSLMVVAHAFATSGSAESRVIGPHGVAGLQLGLNLTYAKALTYFRRQGLDLPSATFSIWGCTLRWKSAGLALEWDGPGPPDWRRASPATCTRFVRATVTGPRWHTRNGLHVGATLAEMTALFPRAFDNGLGKPQTGVHNWCAYWALVSPPFPPGGLALMACTTHGRIASFFVEFVGH